MDEIQSFTRRNEDLVLKKTKGGVLSFLVAILIEFERISIINVLDRVSWKHASRVRIIAHAVFRTMNGGILTHRLSNSIDNELATNFHTSKWRNCTQNEDRRRFNVSFRITNRILTNFNLSRIRTRIVKTLHPMFV